MYQEAVDLARESGNKLILTTGLIGMGEHHRFHGNLDKAWLNYDEALEERQGDRESRERDRHHSGEPSPGAHSQGGPGPCTTVLILECVDIILNHDMKGLATGLFDIVAGLLGGRGDWEGAARFLGIADALYKYFDYHREPADLQFAQGVIDKTKAALDPAAYQAAYDTGLQVGADVGLSEIKERLGS